MVKIFAMKDLTAHSDRIQSIDLLRGLIMVLMAIDHVRVYSGLPAGGPDPAIFFTRWVTHFCAPGFAFFAGTSIFLMEQNSDKRKVIRFVLTRGLLLVFLELTLIRFLWAFHVNFKEFVLAGVIWMLGWCMVLMAVIIRMKTVWVVILGLAIIFLQQIFGLFPQVFPESSRSAIGGFWAFFYSSGYDPLGGVAVLYVLIPWIGVMAAGYGFGAILKLPSAKRNQICLIIGISAIVVFVIVGTVILLSRPTPDNAPPFLIRLLNQNKYPASQLFLLMTLGPLIALVPWAERATGWLVNTLKLFGRVPMFYYLLHILIIHLSAMAVQFFLLGELNFEWYNYAPFASVPDEFRWSLLSLYIVFSIDLVILYFLCRWFLEFKKRHNDWSWLKFM